jgi:hypothetical protein
VTIAVARESALATFAARTDSCAVWMSCWPPGASLAVVADLPELPAPASSPLAADAAEGAAMAAGADADAMPSTAEEPAAELAELDALLEQPAAVTAMMRITPGIPATPSRRRRPAKARVVRMPLGRRRRAGRLRREVTIRQHMPSCVKIDVCPTTFA